MENGKIPPNQASELETYILRLEKILRETTTSEENGRWGARKLKQIRESLAKTAGSDSSASLAESFKSFGILTELRDDDISPIARQGRLGNYIKRIEKEGKVSFEPGLATQALCEDLRFQFTPEGSFYSEARNCIVVRNGQSRRIGLEQFQSTCELSAKRLYRETESRRKMRFIGKEEQRISREREY